MGAVGDVVKWTGADDDVPKSCKGIVSSFAGQRVCVTFPRGTWAFQLGELIHVGQSRFGFALGDPVQWLEYDSEVPLGTKGEVVGFIPDREMVCVQFASGQFNLPPDR